ncbi:unnamed protein product [Gulo gulo]|uniref:Uncharacterized protein n=1 Tax=Gulo gulo TaxID=48420 RepID=A0A9X9M2F8_GULGU|nr:unnamed protein product [Gulo gulo]
MCQQMETNCAPSWPLPSLGTKKGPVHMTERTCVEEDGWTMCQAS